MNDLIVNSISNTIAAVGISATIVISAAWVIRSIITSMKQRANTRTRAELYNKLFDKFGSAPELVEFLRSDAGLRFIEEQAAEPSQPLMKIMSSIRLGVSLGLVGGGILVVANLWDRTFGEDIYNMIALVGTVALTAGVGFIIAAAISYKLCKSWGLIPSLKNESVTEH
jgi:hypothetical protein